MNTRKVYLYVFDTMADWEIGYLTAELNSGRYFKKGIPPVQVITVGNNKNFITTMGGLKVLPEISIDECNLKDEDVLVLPGGFTWTESIHDNMLEKVKVALMQGNLVAAICGATLGLAKRGILNSRSHTSNDLEYLKMVVPNYIGEKYYRFESVVTDENLITSSGLAPLEFTMQVLRLLDVFKEETLQAWFNVYKTQDPKYFFELMNSMK
ncbi:Putative intracellular protease/amidase [Clostridium cavendishii DSM 21758]|uniref:Putative intracellular protease/amidase n=1 Tax=Clostridium cavendishii DSM 21758 TaxID=1121302 RepID=A0A1M6GQW6_9CLOT|nr:type 1 glutamine amidotransferase family protein [Clostridium cavendishii]SHJ12357.1 Putative intracellular protease/amidase [Clostridium cavendishii DSM 21758]